MKSPILLVTLFVFIVGCASWKSTLVSKGGQSEAINNAINDFFYTGEAEKGDSVFYLYTKTINDEILGISIRSTYDKVLISTEDKIIYSSKGLPTGYIERSNMLFYWHDSEKDVTDDLIYTYKKYNLLDTMIVNVYMPVMTVSDDKRGVDYYFCKNNLLKYRKVRTYKALGYYNPPNLYCD